MSNILNFNMNIDDYIVCLSELKTVDYRPNAKLVTIPINSVLKIENITLGGMYKRNALEIVFKFTKKNNFHLGKDKVREIPSLFRFTIYALNGFEYDIIQKDGLERKLESLLRISKIENIENVFKEED